MGMCKPQGMHMGLVVDKVELVIFLQGHQFFLANYHLTI
jgi:hypothetical protein